MFLSVLKGFWLETFTWRAAMLARCQIGGMLGNGAFLVWRNLFQWRHVLWCLHYIVILFIHVYNIKTHASPFTRIIQYPPCLRGGRILSTLLQEVPLAIPVLLHTHQTIETRMLLIKTCARSWGRNGEGQKDTDTTMPSKVADRRRRRLKAMHRPSPFFSSHAANNEDEGSCPA